MDQPQPCTKCKKLPQDILMLACSHDLCLDCAAERLAFQMKKKKPANSIVCEICYERTALDAESVAELEKLIPNRSNPPKTYVQPRQPYDRVERIDRTGPRSQVNEKIPDKTYDKQPIRDYSYTPAPAATSNSMLLSGVSNKKICGQHNDEQILYFCFDCKCECICPECIIHGKHKDHDVKTIRKSSPVIRGQLEKTVQKVQNSIENLLVRKSEVEKNIRSISDQNAQVKRQVQSAFEQVRTKLALKQKQILSKLDIELNQSIEDLEKSIKTIIKKMDDLKSYSSATAQVMKREDVIMSDIQMMMLNFYAKRWKQISQQSKDVNISIPQVSIGGNDNKVLLSSILEITDNVDQINLAQRKR